MVASEPTNISAAFEMLLEEIEIEVDNFGQIAARASEKREFEKAKEAIETAEKITTFRDKVAILQEEWDKVEKQSIGSSDDINTYSERRNLGRLQRGLRTREDEFYLPILFVIEKMGGSAKISDVLDKVEELMKPKLKEVDYEPLASDSNILRWRNTAQWARATLVKKGLLASDSPRGVWEITEKGRKELRKIISLKEESA